MARRHGRHGAVYLAAASGAAASPVTFQAAWTVDATAGKIDVTTLADSQHVYVAGLPGISGTFTGFWDDQTSQTYVAAVDGLPRAFYLYPDAATAPAVYFAGPVIADFTAGGGSGGPVSVASTWQAAGPVQRYPQAGALPGVLDETAAAEVTDEGGGIITNEDGELTAMSKISAYTALTSPASSDVLPVVDVSDTSMAASGTTKKTTISTLLTTGTGAAVNVLNTAYAGGADPAGSAACDAAFSAAVTAALASGQPVIIPPGTYKTTATLNWKATGLIIRAPAGPDNTTISCTGSNIPIAQFAGSYQDISGLTFTYATPQTSGQTAANVITFGDDTLGSCYMGNYHELNLRGGQTGMAIDPGITTAAGMFSCRLANITVDTCSSSFISLIGNNALGGANCTGCVFENIYLGGASGTLAGTPILMKCWDEFVFSQLNIEHCTVTSQDVLSLSVTANAVINSLHFEGLTTSGNGGSLLHLSGAGTTVINGMSVRLNVYTGSGSNPLINFFGTGPYTLIINGLNESGCTVTTPSHPLVNFGTATNCAVQITGQTGSQTTATAVNTGAGDAVKIIGAGSGVFLCPPVQYAPGTIASPTTSSATMAAVSSANINTGAFTVPVSGSVKVTTGFIWNDATSGGTAAFALAAHGTVSPLLSNVIVMTNNTQKVSALLEWVVTGLTPGASVNLDLMYSSPAATVVTLYVIGQTTTTPAATPEGPVTMTVQAV